MEVAPNGGLTGIVDGIALYRAISTDVRDRIEGHTVISTMDVIMRTSIRAAATFVDVEPSRRPST